MKDIAVYGSGGLGKGIVCLLNNINKFSKTWNFIGYFDDTLPVQTKCQYGTILGGIDELNNRDSDLAVVIAIANPLGIRKIFSLIKNKHIYFPNIISSDVFFSDEQTITLGIGNIITARCMIEYNVTLGDFNILNLGTILGHDIHIGNYNVFNPCVNISGNVNIGNGNFFGVKSTVLEKITLGNNTTIGACALVTKNTKDDLIYIGVPAKIKNQK